MTQAGATTSTGGLAGVRLLAASAVHAARVDPAASVRRLLPALLTTISFTLLFAQPFASLVRDWWTLPEAGHGLLLAPVAVWLAWKAGACALTRGPRRVCSLNADPLLKSP